MLTDALLIFGAGGHGRVVADAARAAGATGLLASDRNPALCQEIGRASCRERV